jgi:hypothetical protein
MADQSGLDATRLTRRRREPGTHTGAASAWLAAPVMAVL